MRADATNGGRGTGDWNSERSVSIRFTDPRSPSPVPRLIVHLRQVFVARLDRRERIFRLIVFDERVLDVRAMLRVIREDLREVDGALAYGGHRVLRIRLGVLHVYHRDATWILLHVRERV